MNDNLTSLREAREEIERWKRIAQHLCFKRGHGPKPLWGDMTKCGTCEAPTDKFTKMAAR